MTDDQFGSGTLADRPWGQTLSTLARRGVTGQLELVADDRVFTIAFDLGMIVSASSPLASDAIARIALQTQLISSTYVAEITRRIAAAPDRDEIEVVTEAVQLTPELSQRLRRRAILQRAARTFAADVGAFAFEPRIAMPAPGGSAIDVRAVIYRGAHLHLPEQRLAADLRAFGSHFVLRVDALETIGDYELTAAEQPVIDALSSGTNLPELEATHREIDPRTAQAVVYALACCGACEIEHRPSIARTATAMPRSTDREIGRAGLAQPVRGRPATTMGGADAPRPARLVPTSGGYSLRPPHDPGVVSTPRTRTEEAAARGAAPEGDPIDPPTARGTPGLRPGTTPPATQPRATSQPRAATGSGAPPVSRTKTGEPANARTNTSRGPAVARTSTARRTQALVAARSILVEQGADYFALLGVAFDAPADAVRTAYFQLATQLHPDKLAELEVPDDQGMAARLFAHMGNAFAVLTDPVRRQQYLEQLSGAPAMPAPPRTVTASEVSKAAAAEAARRAELALKGDRPADAVTELTRACELEPKNFDYAALLGWAQFCAATDKVAAAVDARRRLERAILRSDQPEVARFYLGRVERILGRDLEALRHFDSVLEASPGHAEAAAEIRAITVRLGGGGGRRR